MRCGMNASTRTGVVKRTEGLKLNPSVTIFSVVLYV
jgi:hypothetical protein